MKPCYCKLLAGSLLFSKETMNSLPNIGFSLYPEEPVSTFRSVGKAAFPNIVAAPSPFMAAPLPPSECKPDAQSRTTFSRAASEREGLGLFTAAQDSAKPGNYVTLLAFEQLQKQFDTLAVIVKESDLLLKAALARIAELELDVKTLREMYQEDPFAGGIPLMFSNNPGGGCEMDFNALATAVPTSYKSAGKGMTFTVLNESDNDEHEHTNPEYGSEGCEEYKASGPGSESDQQQYHFKHRATSEDEDGVDEDENGVDKDEDGVDEDEDGVDEDEDGVDEDEDGVDEDEDGNEDEDEDENGFDDGNENENSESEVEENGENVDEDEDRDYNVNKSEEDEGNSVRSSNSTGSQNKAGSVPSLPVVKADLSSVRTISFPITHRHKQLKTTTPTASSPAADASNATSLAYKIASKSERDLARLLVPELTEMLATFGEAYAPPKHESVALLRRRAAEVKAAASES